MNRNLSFEPHGYTTDGIVETNWNGTTIRVAAPNEHAYRVLSCWVHCRRRSRA